MNGYEPLWMETDDGVVCRDCGQWCYFGTPMLTPCDRDGCACPACAKARRALELDDRPDEQRDSLARDMEHERRPDPDVLQRERFGLRGYPTWGRA